MTEHNKGVIHISPLSLLVQQRPKPFSFFLFQTPHKDIGNCLLQERKAKDCRILLDNAHVDVRAWLGHFLFILSSWVGLCQMLFTQQHTATALFIILGVDEAKVIGHFLCR